MIAAKADTTTGSIYSRFGDKEGLFCAIVEPAAEGLTQIFLKTQEAFHAREAEEQPKVMEDYVVGGMDEMLDYVYDRFDDFRLLLDASYGTKYQDFVEHLVDIETEYTYKYMEATKFLQEGSMIDLVDLSCFHTGFIQSSCGTSGSINGVSQLFEASSDFNGFTLIRILHGDDRSKAQLSV